MEESEAKDAIEGILRIIIDEWYEKVSGFYVTAESLSGSSSQEQEEELKRFHDDTGHRIKFSKDDLDFTYGLRSSWEDDSILIEVSVNNKVENFNIEDFQGRLAAHYKAEGKRLIPVPDKLKKFTFGDIFQLGSDFGEAFKLEIREGKADIMRLSFRLNDRVLEQLLADPGSSKSLLEMYCVTPFRNIYASVYRRSS